jgi:hypothetical protein
MLYRGAGGTQPGLEALISDAGNRRRDQAAFRAAELHRPAATRGFLADAGQRVLARPVVGKLGGTRGEHRAIHLAKARARIPHARLRSGHEHERRGIGGVRNQRRARARAEHGERGAG